MTLSIVCIWVMNWVWPSSPSISWVVKSLAKMLSYGFKAISYRLRLRLIFLQYVSCCYLSFLLLRSMSYASQAWSVSRFSMIFPLPSVHVLKSTTSELRSSCFLTIGFFSWLLAMLAIIMDLSAFVPPKSIWPNLVYYLCISLIIVLLRLLG